MAEEMRQLSILATLLTTVLISSNLIPIVLCEPEIITTDSSKLDTRISHNVKQFVQTKSLDDKEGFVLDDVLAIAEAGLKVITIKKNGSGDFKTVADVVKSIPTRNTKRVIIKIGGGLSVIKAPCVIFLADICSETITLKAPSISSLEMANPYTCGDTFLGRAWRNSLGVIFAYTYMGEHINDQRWLRGMYGESNSNQKKVYYGGYKCMGPGADSTRQAKFAKILSDAEVEPFLSMTYLEGNKWVLPPPKV
ncbi:hypothetical protein Patl1_23793 [Pistacia atlantica]|uniref:Uncharacterized protein n=1 Tax=Pistacia atlantica TaxID=434234 RepID=A0ACC0ZYQ2_9ROSI|nr:hypothetical protein Patl1_23793 [Pistacia atlantica]